MVTDIVADKASEFNSQAAEMQSSLYNFCVKNLLIKPLRQLGIDSY